MAGIYEFIYNTLFSTIITQQELQHVEGPAYCDTHNESSSQELIKNWLNPLVRWYLFTRTLRPKKKNNLPNLMKKKEFRGARNLTVTFPHIICTLGPYHYLGRLSSGRCP